MRIAFCTLGCKVNQYETQALERLFTARGHVLAPFEGEADVYVINSCKWSVRPGSGPRTQWWPCAAVTLRPTRRT